MLTYGPTGLSLGSAFLRWSDGSGSLGATGLQVSANNGANWGILYDTIYNPMPGSVVYCNEYLSSTGPTQISSLPGVTTSTVYIKSHLTGGGGGGGVGDSSALPGGGAGGGGGGSGFISDIESVPIPSTSTITINVGAGGIGGVSSSGADGDTTQLLITTTNGTTFLWNALGGQGGFLAVAQTPGTGGNGGSTGGNGSQLGIGGVGGGIYGGPGGAVGVAGGNATNIGGGGGGGGGDISFQMAGGNGFAGSVVLSVLSA